MEKVDEFTVMSKSLMTTCMEVAITDNWIVLVWLIMEDSSISPPSFPATCMEYADSNTAITQYYNSYRTK